MRLSAVSLGSDEPTLRESLNQPSVKVVKFEKSSRDGKKYMVVVEDGAKKKTIHFGAEGYEDYTEHKDEKRKEAYLKRHEAREDWTDPMTAGFWSRWVLWNKPSIKMSFSDTVKRFDLKA